MKCMPRRTEDAAESDVVTVTLDLETIDEPDVALELLEAGADERSPVTAGQGADRPTVDIANVPASPAADGSDDDVVSK